MRPNFFACAALLVAISMSSVAYAADYADSVSKIASAKTREERNTIVQDLRKHRDDARSAILGGVKSEDPSVRATCIGLLVEFNNADDIPAVTALTGTDEKDAPVRTAAIYALGRYTDLAPAQADSIRTTLATRYGAEDATPAERLAALTSMAKFPAASLTAVVTANLKAGISAGEAAAIIRVLDAVGDAAAQSALVDFLELKAEAPKKEEDKKPEGDTPEGDKPEGETPVEEKAPVVETPKKWAFEPEAMQDKRIWQTIRLSAVLALANHHHAAAVSYLLEDLKVNVLQGSAAESVLDAVMKRNSEAVGQALVEILSDLGRVGEHQRAAEMLSHTDGSAFQAILAKLDEATATRNAEIARLEAERAAKGDDKKEEGKDEGGDVKPDGTVADLPDLSNQVQNLYENTFRTVANAFGKTEAGRQALLARLQNLPKLERDPSQKICLEAILNNRQGTQISDAPMAFAVFAAMHQNDRNIVRLGISNWEAARGVNTVFEMVNALTNHPDESIREDKDLLRDALGKITLMVQSRRSNMAGPETIDPLKELVHHDREVVREMAWNAFSTLDNPDLFETFAEGFKDPSPVVAASAARAFSGYCQNLALYEDKRSDLQAKAKQVAFDGLAAKNGASAGLTATLSTLLPNIFGSGNLEGPMQNSLKKMARGLLDSDVAYLRLAASKLNRNYQDEDFQKKLIARYQVEDNPAVADGLANAISAMISTMSTEDKEAILKTSLKWLGSANDLKYADFDMIDNLQQSIPVGRSAQNIISNIGNKTIGKLYTLTTNTLRDEVVRITAELPSASDEKAQSLLWSLTNISQAMLTLDDGLHVAEVIAAGLVVKKTDPNLQSTAWGNLSQALYNYFAKYAKSSDMEQINKIEALNARISGLTKAIADREATASSGFGK